MCIISFPAMWPLGRRGGEWSIKKYGRVSQNFSGISRVFWFFFFFRSLRLGVSIFYKAKDVSNVN